MVLRNIIPKSTYLEKVTLEDVGRIAEWIKRKHGKRIIFEIARQKAIMDMKDRMKKQDFDYNKLKSDFLMTRNSQGTRQNYNAALIYFEEYIMKKMIHPLDVRAAEADMFVHRLARSKYSPATQRLYICAIGAFYSRLVRWEYLDQSPWKGIALPKKIRVKELHIPTRTDIRKMRQTIRGYVRTRSRRSRMSPETRRNALVIFDLLVHTGMRIGAISTLKVGRNRTITGWSKGKFFESPIGYGLSLRIRNVDFAAVSKAAVQKMIARACRESGAVVFSGHSLRHRFAIEHYRKNRDIFELCRLLNHSNLAVTEAYLKSLRVISGQPGNHFHH